MKRELQLLCALCATSAFAIEESVTRYEIVSKGMTIGHVETARAHVERDGVDYLHCRMKTKVDVDLLVVNYHMEGTEEILLGPDGVVQFAIVSAKNGRHLEAHGGLTNGIFHCLRIVDGVTNRVDVPRTNFVATTLDGLELKLVKGEPARTEMVFDCAEVKTLQRSYCWNEDEELAVGKEKKSCRVVQFEDPVKKGRRWVYEDDWGMVIARQDAKEPTGSYSLRMKETFTRPMSTAAAAPVGVSAR